MWDAACIEIETEDIAMELALESAANVSMAEHPYPISKSTVQSFLARASAEQSKRTAVELNKLMKGKSMKLGTASKQWSNTCRQRNNTLRLAVLESSNSAE